MVGLIGFFCFLLSYFSVTVYYSRLEIFVPMALYGSRYGFVCLCVAQFKRLFYWLLEWNLADGQDDGLLFGVNRAVRSDEWAVNTPMALPNIMIRKERIPILDRL